MERKAKLKHALALTLCLPWLGIAHAGMTDPTPLPAAAWKQLESTRGIRIGGRPGQTPAVQLICDTNCPYCAKLVHKLQQERPGLAVRWLPVAYFKPDSAAMAAALLAAPDPAASLIANYRGYDFTARHGAYQPPPGRHYTLDPEHDALKQQWLQWGGFTPMVIVRTQDGRILQAQGSSAAFLDSALDQAAPAKQLKAWQPTSAKGD